jgi:UDP-N-acetylenolpyruvoylglucosamine reductase
MKENCKFLKNEGESLRLIHRFGNRGTTITNAEILTKQNNILIEKFYYG